MLTFPKTAILAVGRNAGKGGITAAKDYKTASALRKACRAYFSRCDEAGRLYGEAGLALDLDVPLETLRDCFDGKCRPDLREEVRRAYLAIQSQLESDPAYMGRGMTSKAVFLLKQPRLGNYQAEARRETAVRIELGDGMDESDFQ